MTLSRDAPPPTSGHRRLFRCGLSYTVLADGAFRTIVPGNGSEASAAWVARLAADGSNARVHCRRVHEDGSFDTPVRYPLDQFLTMYALAPRGGAIVHGAGLALDGRGFLLAGRSGAGKSTFARLALACGAGQVLGDDRIAARRVGEGQASPFRIYGTPWPGDARVAVNDSAPLAALLVLQKADRCEFRRLPPGAALDVLLATATIPWYDRAVLPSVLDTCGELASRVPAYEFRFPPDGAAVRALREFSESLPEVSAT